MTVPCKHFSLCGFTDGGCCALGEYGGKISRGVCMQLCQKYQGPPRTPELIEATIKGDTRSRGLGDTLAKGIKAATFGLVTPCGGCQQRQATLNKLLPYRR